MDEKKLHLDLTYGIGIDGLFKSRRGPKAELSNFYNF